MKQLIKLEPYLSPINQVAVFLFFSLTFYFKEGYYYGLILLTGSAFLTLPIWWKKRLKHYNLFYLSAIFIFWGLWFLIDTLQSGLLSQVIHFFLNIPDTEIKNIHLVQAIGIPMKLSLFFLILPIILYYLSAYPIKKETTIYGVLVGLLLAFAYAIKVNQWNIVNLMKYRFDGPNMNAIQFGNIMTIYLMILGTSLFFLKSRWQLFFILNGLILAIFFVLVAQSRGSLVALFLLFICTAFHMRKRLFNFHYFKVFLAIGLLSTGVGFFTFKYNDMRFKELKSDIHHYSENRPSTSIGLRFEMWKFSMHQGLTYFPMGSGSKQMMADKLEYDKSISQSGIREFPHTHNEYLDIFARFSLFGVILLTIFYFVPLSNYFQIQGHGIMKSMGIFHLILSVGFGLTYASIMHHENGFAFYAIPLIVFYTSALNEERKNHHV